jgi:uncharacterized protein YegL
MIYKNKFIYKITIFTLLIFTSSLFIFSNKVKSNEAKVPILNITTSQSTITAGVNEEFSITYHVQPQPIPLDKISPQTEKEIVLVIDTSGSMASSLDSKNTRISALKTAAKNFVDKFAGNDKVYLGIVDYDTYSKVITKTSYSDGFISASTNNISTIKNLIDNKLDAEGGTNIGDGIRTALNILNRNNNRKKYIIVMSDGEPTALTYTGKAGYYMTSWMWGKYYSIEETIHDSSNNVWWWSSKFQENTDFWNYYTSLSNYSQKYGVIPSTDTDPGLFLKYSKIMAEEIKKAGYTSYFIGFSNESNSNKLSQISASAGGIYLDAKDAFAIDKVYSDIADQIKADYMVEQVNFNFNLPGNITYAGSQLNLTVNGSSYSKKLPNITYILNSTKTYYEAQPFDIVINLKALKSGTYNLGSSDGWNITYKSVNGTIVNEVIPNVSIAISSINLGFSLNRKILGVNDNLININKEFKMEYNITPTPISTSASIKGKEVILVMDTSKSMGQNLNGEDTNLINEKKLSIMKDTASLFIDNLKGNSNVNVGIVTFNKGASVCDFGNSQYLIPSSNEDIIKNKINSITLSPDSNDGSNIGDGIRKALWLLSSNNNKTKYIVVISDGNADYYSYNKNDSSSFYINVDNESESGGKLAYAEGIQAESDGATKGEKYSKIMAETMKNNFDQVVKPYFIALGNKADVNLLNTLSSVSNGNFINCASNDKNLFLNNMEDIADIVRSEFIIRNSILTESLPEGLQFSDSNKYVQINIPKIVYVYNSLLKQYTAEAFSIDLTIKGTSLGNYILTNDAVFQYKDIEGNSINKKFPDFNLKIKDDYVLKQGLFNIRPSDNTLIGESYLNTDLNATNIADNFITQVAAYLKTSGQKTTLKISINKDLNNNIKNIDNLTCRVYKVNPINNSLNEINGICDIRSYGNNYNEIIINIPESTDLNYNYYIINYNFKAKGDIEKGYKVNCTALIEETQKNNTLILNAVGLPDLF